MKPLKILTLGPMTLAVVITTGFVIAFPVLRSPGDILLAFGIAMIAGLFFFAPVAAAVAFRGSLRRWLDAHGHSVQWCASILMSMSLGYLFASVRYHGSDAMSALALLVLFTGALAKTIFSIVYRTGDEPPSGGGNGGGGWRPPFAPVRHPGGGHPPGLSSAATVKHEPAVS
jgi:hypothetical protein